MPTWLEIRCENMGQTFDRVTEEPPKTFHEYAVTTSERCWSLDNSGPMDMACDDNASILQTMVLLRKQAKESGWKRTRDGWYCPVCCA